MLEVNAQNLSVVTDATIAFTKVVQTNSTAKLATDGKSILLQAPGYYLVTFNGYGAATADSSNIGAQLVADGVAVPQAQSMATTASAAAPQAVGFSSVVSVAPAPAGNTATIAVAYTGSAGTLVNASLIIQRLQ